MEKTKDDKLLKEYEMAQRNHHHYDTLQQAMTSFLVGSTLAALWLSMQYEVIRTSPVYVSLLGGFSIIVAVLWRLFIRRLGFFMVTSLERCWHIEKKLFNIKEEKIKDFREMVKAAKGDKSKEQKLGEDIPLHNYISKKDKTKCLQQRGLTGFWFNNWIFIAIFVTWFLRILMAIFGIGL